MHPTPVHPQVGSRSGEFICAPSIPEAVLINIADLLQRWTSDQFISVVSEEGLLLIQYASCLDEKGLVDLTVCLTGVCKLGF